MMKKLLLLSVFACCTTTIFSGDEFWIHPDKFIYGLGERATIRLMEGQNFEGRNWNGNRSNVKALTLYYADVTDDCLDQLSQSDHGDSLQVSFFEEGTMMFTFIDQPGKQDSGRSEFKHNAKTIIQIGKKITGTFKRQTSLPVDLIPQENPYRLRDGEKLKVKLYFRKKPLTNAPITVWHRNNEQTVKTDLRTDEKGEAEFPVFVYGAWMVTAVRDGYAGSLTWGYFK